MTLPLSHRAAPADDEQLDLLTTLDEDEGLDPWIESLPCPPWVESEGEKA
jgi:hypothetical protein